MTQDVTLNNFKALFPDVEQKAVDNCLDISEVLHVNLNNSPLRSPFLINHQEQALPKMIYLCQSLG
ncbi:hypothetical protein PROFUN_14969 [Planoprotostelium fungivorum]|uniref:Uncharacterized protein n=1 Tax=Planoprotostelium fungivorum TaxID=1890364 RepID=A0A2P6MY81_9EUKA|nr:hypothetical protein PROFUN_14969 [Planoprotostelium fungivorum]